MGKLIIDNGKYLVDGQELKSGMDIRRYDPVAGRWFSGEVGIVHGKNFETGQRVVTFGLIGAGYAPSPLVLDDEIEILSESA